MHKERILPDNMSGRKGFIITSLWSAAGLAFIFPFPARSSHHTGWPLQG